MIQKLKPIQFRWKYAVSAFLVCGVLSIGLGTSNQPDPLVAEAKRLKQDYEKLFKINKDPKTATDAELDGPTEKTIPLTLPQYNAFVAKLRKFGDRIERESFDRQANPDFTVNGPANTGVKDAAILYQQIQMALYMNYMRLAHDETFKVEREGAGAMRNFLDYIDKGGDYVDQRKKKQWEEQLAARRSPGARAFQPDALDFLDLEVSQATARLLFESDDADRKMSLRTVRDADGSYQRVRFFLNSYEKQNAEYFALISPNTKEQYLKLVQFAAIRESLTNRWAIRRLNDAKSYPETNVPVCGEELVSFRSPEKTSIGQLEAYDSLWQLDRYKDLINMGGTEAVAAIARKDLFSKETLAAVMSTYGNRVSDQFESMVGEDQLMMAAADFYASGNEMWEKGTPEMKTSQANEAFLNVIFPADDLTSAAVAERYAAIAYQVRKSAMARLIWTAFASLEVTENGKPVLKDGRRQWFFPNARDPKQIQEVDRILDEAIQRATPNWKADAARAVRIAIDRAMGPSILVNGRPLEIGHTKNDNADRLTQFIKQVEPTALKGVQGMNVRADALERIKLLGKFVRPKDDPTSSKIAAGMSPTLGFKSNSAVGRAGNTKGGYLASLPPEKDRSDPKLYWGDAPFRNPARAKGMKSWLIPSTPDELSKFYYKKLETIAKYDVDMQYVEQKLAVKISNSAVVSRGLNAFFSELQSQYDALQIKPDAPDDVKAAGLEKAILPAARKIFKDFYVGLSKPPKYLYPERAARANAKKEAEEKAVKERQAKVQETAKAKLEEFKRTGSMGSGNQGFERRESTGGLFGKATKAEEKKAADEKKKEEDRARKLAEAERFEKNRRLKAYFRRGVDTSLRTEGNDFYVEKAEQRKEVFLLFSEAFAAMGIFWDVSSAKVNLKTSEWFLPDQVNSWIAAEKILRDSTKDVGMLRRMTATLLDQQVMGEIRVQDAHAEQPILALQTTWNRDHFKDPVLLTRLKRAWDPKKGWDHKFFVDTFRWAVTTTAKNDLNKAETFCKADIREYRRDENFRLMFNAVTGLRASLSSTDTIRKWDEEIAKESRTWKQAMLEDYFDPFVMWVGAAMMLVMVWQFAPAILGFVFQTGAIKLAFDGAALSLGTMLGGSAKLLQLLMIGNLSPVNLIFLAQTLLMGSVYHVTLPPQANFTFSLANSRFQNMQSAQIVGKPMVDREKMEAMIDDLNTQSTMTYVSYGTDILLQGAFAAHSIRKDLGFATRAKMARFSVHSSPEVKQATKMPGLGELVKEKGVLKGGAEYVGTAVKPMVKGLSKISAVKKGEEAKAGLYAMMADNFSALFPDKESLRAFYADKARESAGAMDEAQREVATIFPEIFRGVDPKSKATVRVSTLIRRVDGVDSILDEVRANGADAWRDKNLKNRIQERVDSRPETWDGKNRADGKQVDYFTVVVDRRAEKMIEARLNSADPAHFASADEKSRVALVVAAKLDARTSESVMYRKLLKNLEGLPAKDGEKETAGFFRSFSPSDWEMHRSVFGRGGVTGSASEQKKIKDLYEDFDALMKDWEAISPRARAVRNFLKTRRTDIYIDKKLKRTRLNEAEFLENPQDYQVYTFPVVRPAR